ncbi:hypothetical protein CDAR_401601 [Caerostris darwini]|uniref:Uncharacterized protein n=1 Tax=Caerostris darwini TaxID=1538125 RepID=A0AAV4RX93_9ARAC|nr:hypothetical protein CDAR_401601 [Caerostris darwini]
MRFSSTFPVLLEHFALRVDISSSPGPERCLANDRPPGPVHKYLDKIVNSASYPHFMIGLASQNPRSREIFGIKLIRRNNSGEVFIFFLLFPLGSAVLGA